jgi:hypothetical protein
MSRLELLQKVLGANVLDTYPVFLKGDGYIIKDDLLSSSEIDELKSNGFSVHKGDDGDHVVELGFDADIRKALSGRKLKLSSGSLGGLKRGKKNKVGVV